MHRVIFEHSCGLSTIFLCKEMILNAILLNTLSFAISKWMILSLANKSECRFYSSKCINQYMKSLVPELQNWHIVKIL